MKTTEQLIASLVASNVEISALEASFKLGDFEVDTGCDGESVYTVTSGTATARVLGGTVYFTVSNNGEVLVDPDGEHGCADGDTIPDDDDVYEAWLAQVTGDLGDDVAEYLTERFERSIDGAASDAAYDAADAAEYARDPYAYNGVRRSDFY